MKKGLLLTICSVLFIGLLGCGGADAQTPNEGIQTEEGAQEGNEPKATPAVETVDVADATDLLTDVWDTYEEAELFSIVGGDYDRGVMDAPGKYDVSKVEDMDSVLGLPKESTALIDDAASIMHMMNANTFTCGAFHVTDAANLQTLADSLKDNIMNRQWVCGFPDTLIIVSVGDEYVVSAFGNAEMIENFKTKLLAQYDVAEVMYEESLMQ